MKAEGIACPNCEGFGEVEKPYEPLLDVAEEAFKEMIHPTPGIKLPLWKKFTELTGGLRKRELTLMTAPTGSGKTQFNANISLQLLMQNIPHFVAAVETGRHDYVRRMSCAVAREDYNDGEPVSEFKVQELVHKYNSLWRRNNIMFSKMEDRVEGKHMMDVLRRAVEYDGCQVAILDNLNFFLKIVSTNMEKAEMDDAIHNFVLQARSLDISTILIVHPKKTENARVESEFDIKGSSTAVQEASNVWLFNRPKQKDLDDGNLIGTDREMKFCKLRKRGKNVGVRLYFTYEAGLYVEKTMMDQNGRWVTPEEFRGGPATIRRPYQQQQGSVSQ